MLYLWMPEYGVISHEGASVTSTFRWRASKPNSSKPLGVEGWQTVQGWDALLAATAAENEQEVTVFFPTSSVQMLRQPMSRPQLRQLGTTGLRYLLEEYTLTPIDQLDVRHQHRGNDLTVLAKPQQDVAALLASFGLTPWRVVAALPDFLLLPMVESSATLLLDGTNRILRLDDSYAVSADNLEITLARLNDIKQIQVIGELSNIDRATLEAQKAASGLDWQLLDVPVSSIFSVDGITHKHPYNLTVNKQETGLSPYWKVVAGVLFAAITVQMLYDAVRIWRYHGVEQVIKAQAEQQYRQWFPDEQKIIDLKKQMKGHLNGLGAVDMTALSILSRVGPALSQANLPAHKIHYATNAGTGQLELQINAPSLPALENLRSQIATQGLTAELGAVNSANKPSGNEASGQVSGTIRVKL
ncbi:MAG: type II secretion system protein GspL [Aquirhabdus sp.]